MDTYHILQSSVNFPVALYISGPSAAYQGCQSSSFDLYLFTENNAEYTIDLYSRGSNSIPWQDPQNRWSHLNPQWRFIDGDGNVVNSITTKNAILTTYGALTGYMASAKFYYTDDMPVSSLTLIATVDFSNYPAYKDSIYLQNVPSYSNSKVLCAMPLIINDLTPSSLSITRDGINPLFGYYWVGAGIPHIVSIIGTASSGAVSAVMKNIPITNALGITGGVVNRTISNISSSHLTWNPNTSSAYLSALDKQGFSVGGYLKGNVISDSIVNNATIYATVSCISGGTTYFLSGASESFDICDYDNYNIRRFNESWGAIDHIKTFVKSPHIIDNPVYWDKYMRALWGDASTEDGKGFGRDAYERISNFTSNHADINTCNIQQLYSLAQYTDVPIDEYGIIFPPELRRVMDIGSINQQVLWGARCKCAENIANIYTTYLSGRSICTKEYECDICGHLHSGNRGDLFSPVDYIVSAFNPFIVEDRSNNSHRYELIMPPMISALSSYPLSGYYNILLPKVYEFAHTANENDFQQAITYFCFYEYIPIQCTSQTAGIINWDDQYTTLSETASTVDEWYGKEQSLERIINYVLHKGLGLVE